MPGLLRAAEIRGVVTRAGTPERFFVDEREVRCTPGKTRVRQLRTDGLDPEEHAACPQWFLGDPVTVLGRKEKSTGVVFAKVFELDPPASRKVEGFAIIDRIVEAAASGESRVRADGYVLRVTPKTRLVFADGTGQQLATNEWAAYTGTFLPDGTVDAQMLSVSANRVTGVEGVLRKRTEFDAAAVKESDRQGGVSKFFLGRNAKKIPAYDDAAMQARVSAVGQRLIPEFQRNLPATDPTKIDFRFQLVDDPTLQDGLTLTSGIVLVSYQVVEALHSDVELAAVLATGIAEVMQEQAVRALPGNLALSGGNTAAIVAGLFVPGVGLGGTAALGLAQHAREQRQEEQSTRVALRLMDDAGYDIREAPQAWWRLSSTQLRPLDEIAMPRRARYAYHVLSTAWRGKAWTALPQATP